MTWRASHLYSAFFVGLLGIVCASCSTISSENELSTATNFDDAIEFYSNSIVKASSGGITKASLPEKTTESPTYIIYYTVTDPAMLTKKINPNDPVGYEQNLSITNQWSEKFCTEELKSIIKKYNILMISGQLVDSSGEKHSLSACMSN